MIDDESKLMRQNRDQTQLCPNAPVNKKFPTNHILWLRDCPKSIFI